MTALEKGIRELTRAANGRYQRPWMTEATQPEGAGVFIVGMNQAKTIPTSAVPE